MSIANLLKLSQPKTFEDFIECLLLALPIEPIAILKPASTRYIFTFSCSPGLKTNMQVDGLFYNITFTTTFGSNISKVIFIKDEWETIVIVVKQLQSMIDQKII